MNRDTPDAVLMHLDDETLLIGLSLTNGLQWLENLFGIVRITNVVADELLPGNNKPAGTEFDCICKGCVRNADQP